MAIDPALLDSLIDSGLTFADCKAAFAKRQDEKAHAYIAMARDRWEREGSIEIDADTITSGSDDKGDYVLAWVWVDDPEGDDEDD